jgi:hypothetical protein
MNVLIKAAGAAKPYQVAFDGGTFGELKEVIAEAGHNINFTNTNTVVLSTQVILATDDSLVPQEENLVLMVVTKKSTAGATYDEMSRNALMQFVKSIKNEQGEQASQHFGNYPTMCTSEVVQLLDEWFENEVRPESTSVEEVTEYVQDAIDLVSGARDALDIVLTKLQNSIGDTLKLLLL